MAKTLKGGTSPTRFRPYLAALLTVYLVIVTLSYAYVQGKKYENNKSKAGRCGYDRQP